MKALRDALAQHSVLILDGGVATELEYRGIALDDELWSAAVLSQLPEAIARVHYDYYWAGADIAISATYQATHQGFARKGIHPWAQDRLFHLAVRLAQDAARVCKRRLPKGHTRAWLVAASVGPYGAFLANGAEYRGNYGLSRQELVEFHAPRMAVLAQTQAHCWAFETIPDRVEVGALLELLARWPQRDAWMSFSCRDTAHLADGTPIEEVAALAAQHEQITALGVNCLSPQWVTPLLTRIRTVTHKPLVAYPNSGEQWDAMQRRWEQPTCAVDWYTYVAEWLGLGVRLIGGCCRTRPADIATMRRVCLQTMT